MATATKPKIIAIVGPTAAGKTSLGIYLAQRLGGEVISADSRQVYRGLNLGTGKVTKKETAGIPHHLLDVASPTRAYSASDFTTAATAAAYDIMKYHKVPIVVGGTGFYVDALLGRIVLPDVPPNPTLRAKLEQKSTVQLYALLQKKDPRRARTIEPQHKRRLIRALEIAHALGANPVPATANPYDVLWLGIRIPEQKLHSNIHTRLAARMRAGMVAEAQRLHARGLSYKRMEELGLEYRHLARYLQGKLTKSEMLEQLEREIVHYAKRQMRWFRRNPNIHWVANKREALRLARQFIHPRLKD